MKTDLAVIGQGAVTPAGVGLVALRQGTPIETMTASLRSPKWSWPVYRVNLRDPALERWTKEPRLRRASPITTFLIEAADQALTGLDPAARAQTGLIVAFSTGCMAYTRRFFEGIVQQGQKSASPALFPETVFNSPVSHVAATLKLGGAAYALVGDETAWLAALRTAVVWLRRARVRQVLVLGAEEFDAASLDAYRSARWLRRLDTPFIPSEGAAGILVRLADPGDTNIVSQIEDGFIYRTPSQAQQAARRCLEKFDTPAPLHRSAQRNWLKPMEDEFNRDRVSSSSEIYLGEAATASAAWNTLRALDSLTKMKPSLLVPIWGTNHQIGALELTKTPPLNPVNPLP